MPQETRLFLRKLALFTLAGVLLNLITTLINFIHMHESNQDALTMSRASTKSLIVKATLSMTGFLINAVVWYICYVR